MTLYMHTIDGKPATFDGGMICYARYLGGRSGIALCSSLRQIKREQKFSIQFRHSHGWQAMDYGYVKVCVPASGGD